jgi:hypothetical protein
MVFSCIVLPALNRIGYPFSKVQLSLWHLPVLACCSGWLTGAAVTYSWIKKKRAIAVSPSCRNIAFYQTMGFYLLLHVWNALPAHYSRSEQIAMTEFRIILLMLAIIAALIYIHSNSPKE